MGQFLFRNCVRERKIGSFSGSRKAKNVWAGALAGLMFSVAIFGVMPSGGGAAALDGHIGHGALGGQAQITPRADDTIFYTTSEGVSVKSQNNTLYTTLDEEVYAVLGQGDGTMNSYVGGFTELEYIDNNKSQYFMTDYYPNVNTNFEMKVFVNELNDGHNSLLGCDSVIGSSYYRWSFHVANAAARKVYWNFGMVQTAGTKTFPMQTDVVVFNKKNVLTWKSATDTDTLTSNSMAGAMTTPLAILGVAGENVSQLGDASHTPCRIYYLKIWENDNLVRDFVPALCPICGQPGLYDKVYGKFLGSAGAGKCTAGPNAAPAAAVLDARVYDDFSYASGALEESLPYRTVEGFLPVGGVERGYLLCKAQDSGGYMKLRI